MLRHFLALFFSILMTSPSARAATNDPFLKNIHKKAESNPALATQVLLKRITIDLKQDNLSCDYSYRLFSIFLNYSFVAKKWPAKTKIKSIFSQIMKRCVGYSHSSIKKYNTQGEKSARKQLRRMFAEVSFVLPIQEIFPQVAAAYHRSENLNEKETLAFYLVKNIWFFNDQTIYSSLAKELKTHLLSYSGQAHTDYHNYLVLNMETDLGWDLSKKVTELNNHFLDYQAGIKLIREKRFEKSYSLIHRAYISSPQMYKINIFFSLLLLAQNLKKWDSYDELINDILSIYSPYKDKYYIFNFFNCIKEKRKKIKPQPYCDSLSQIPPEIMHPLYQFMKAFSKQGFSIKSHPIFRRRSLFIQETLIQ